MGDSLNKTLTNQQIEMHKVNKYHFQKEKVMTFGRV